MMPATSILARKPAPDFLSQNQCENHTQSTIRKMWAENKGKHDAQRCAAPATTALLSKPRLSDLRVAHASIFSLAKSSSAERTILVAIIFVNIWDLRHDVVHGVKCANIFCFVKLFPYIRKDFFIKGAQH